MNSVSFKKKYLIIYLVVLGHGCGSWDLHCGMSLSSCGVSLSGCGVSLSSCGVSLSSCGVSLSSCGMRLSSCGMRLSSCGVCLSSCGVTLSSCGVQALESVGSVVTVHRLSCPAACGILVPWLGMEPTFLSLEGRLLTSGPPGKSFFFPSPSEK